jgi:serine-type D-Ala-D-Ala carboxypeptidase (penicillin-binding protein 5/6)
MRRLGPGSVLIGVLALAIAGCGGGGDESTETTQAATTAALSKEELISQGDAICAEVNAAVGTVGSTSSSEAGGETAQVAGLYSGMVERLKALGAPSDEAAGYTEFISSAEALAQAEANVKLAAEREEGEALTAAEAEASTALTSFQSAATAFGFEQCAEAPAAPTPKPSGGESSGGESESGGIEEGAPEEATPEEAPAEEAPPVEEEGAGGGAGVGGGSEGGSEAGGGSGGIGPG